MRILYYISLSFLFSIQLKAQDSDFVFKEELNMLIVKKEGKSPYAFEVIREKYSKTINKPATKRTSSYYKKTLAFAKKAKIDSAKIAELKKESKFTPEIAKNLNEADVNNRLRIARRSLKTLKKYEVVPSEVVIENHYKLKIRRNIFKPEKVIVGEFKSLGMFYVTKSIKGYNESELITIDEVKKKKLTGDNFLFNTAFAVIQNIETETIYMVFPDFLEKFAVKKSSITKLDSKRSSYNSIKRKT